MGPQGACVKRFGPRRGLTDPKPPCIDRRAKMPEREVLLTEWSIDGNGVRIVARSSDPELIALVERFLAGEILN